MNEHHIQAISIGKKISAVRFASGLTQAQVAKKIGCTQKDISRWENGVRLPNAANLKRIASVCKCAMEDLI